MRKFAVLLLLVLTLGAGLSAAVGVYMVAARVMGIEELDDVLALVRRRRVRAPALGAEARQET